MSAKIPLTHCYSDTQPVEANEGLLQLSPRSHGSKVLKAIELGGAHSDDCQLWTRFWTGEESPPAAIPGYLGSVHQWRVLLNPSREHFYSTISRAIFAVKRVVSNVCGIVVGLDIVRKSKLKILDDPCEPKLIVHLIGKNEEHANHLLVSVVRGLEREFSADEQTRIACPQGFRYRDDIGRCVPQWGPSFTRMRSPLLFYQQGGFIESGRALIVQEELEKRSIGLQDRLTAYRNIRGRLSQFFTGEHFYRYVHSRDPFGSSLGASGCSTPIEGNSEDLEVEFDDRIPAFPLDEIDARLGEEERRAVGLLKDLWKELSIDRSTLPRKEFDEFVRLRLCLYKESRSLRDQAKKGALPPSIVDMCSRVFLSHPLLHELEVLEGSPEGIFSPEQLPRLSLRWRSIRELFGVLEPSLETGDDETVRSREECLTEMFVLLQEFQGIELNPGLRGTPIVWLSGSSTASFPSIFHPESCTVPSLIPTGQLLRMRIPPMCGELGVGILPNGVNIGALSGVLVSHVREAVRYAEAAGTFHRETEFSYLERVGTMSSEDMGRVKIAAMRLVKMGMTVHEKGRISRSLRTLIADLAPSEAPKRGWERFLPLLGKIAPSEFLTLCPSFDPGMIVGVETSDRGMVFGEILPSLFAGDITVQNSRSGEPVWYHEWSLYPVHGDSLERLVAEQKVDCSQRAVEEESSNPWHFLVGQPFPKELIPEEPSLQPGTILVRGDREGQGRYVMVIAVRERVVEFLDDSGLVQGMPRLVTKWMRSPPDEFLERELAKEPVLMDMAFHASKVRSFMQGRKEAVEEILTIIETMPPARWTEQEQRFIEKPVPVVFGSLTKQPLAFQNGVSGEVFLEGPQEMGKDIQVIFVPKSRMGEIREYVYSHMPVNPNVYILPLELL